MNRNRNFTQPGPDPLGLRKLPPLDPPGDRWPAIAEALADNRARRNLRQPVAWFAAAAALLMAVSVALHFAGPGEMTRPAADSPVATLDGGTASNDSEGTLDGLIAMSQALEGQVRGLRQHAGPMPASSAVYLAELEDLIAQVDNELSFSPDSVNLWGQRVNLLLDLAQLYQSQWEREYGRIASL